MLHTTISDIIANIDMNSIETKDLPHANYYAMGHIHQVFHKEENNSHLIYPGPTYPNNFQELVDLKSGSFQLNEVIDKIKTVNVKIPIVDVVYVEIELNNGLIATNNS
jgi:DNA repair exonuclease SbcCD nuclease subunit